MNRPAVIRHIVSHVAHNCVTPYRLRTTDAQRLAQYIEHLEAENANLRGGQALEVAHPKADGPAVRRRLALDPEERLGAFCTKGPCALPDGHEGACDDTAGDVAA